MQIVRMTLTGNVVIIIAYPRADTNIGNKHTAVIIESDSV
ncbi:hypothetical protein J2Z65_006936 [Paenibacillus aceris]|uniref:Uncharacterized protein n=1 Tax=Paenibacillus aceris TaxID=869555 RepID=A0ABS4I9Q8_9BACL|nr:hypothetical protein [Paenibacillus aceris]